MAELLAAVAAATLWLAAFGVIALHANRWADRPGSAVLAAYPVFFAFQIVLAKVLSAVGSLTRPAMLAVYILTVAVSLVLYLRRRRPADLPAEVAGQAGTVDAEAGLIRNITIGVAAIVLAGLAGFALISPVYVWDTLAYHVPMVASYVQNGSLEPWPTQDLRQIYRVNGGELQLLNIALLSASDAWVEFANVLALGVCLVAAFELARLALRNEALPYLVVALVLTAPQIQVGTVTAKNDLMFLAVVLGAFVWVIRAATCTDGRASTYSALAAFSVGLAAATKVMGLNVLGAIGLLALVLAALRRLPFRAVIAYGATAALTLVVLVGDIYWSNFSRSAIPVGVAPNEVFFRVGLYNFATAAWYYGYELPIRRLLVLQVFEHDHWHYGYFFPFALALGAVAAARQVISRGARRMGLSALVLMGGALVLSVIAVRSPISTDHRFMTWMVPVLAILAASLFERWDSRRVLVLTAAAASFALVHLFQTFTNEMDGVFTRSATHLLSTGSLARYADVPSRHYLFMIEGLDVLERAAERDSVLYVGTDDSWMYPAWGARFSRHVRGVWDPADAAEQVASRQYRFIVVEAEANGEIRNVVSDAARLQGYNAVADTEGRVILERDDANSPP